MMHRIHHGEGKSEARERVLGAAEQLFARRGYNAVTLRDIGAAAGVHHSSLYHHAPGGKEALFIEVTERSFRHHREGLLRAIDNAGGDIQARLSAVADWLLSQPPMDLVRLAHSDLPGLDRAEAGRLTELAYTSMMAPIADTLAAARGRGEIEHDDLLLLSGGILGMIESLHAIPEGVVERSRQELGRDLIATLLTGLRPRR